MKITCTNAASTLITQSKSGLISSESITAWNYLKQRLGKTGPESEARKIEAIASTQDSETISRGFEKLLQKLSKQDRLKLATLYHYIVRPHNQYGAAGCIRESRLNSWLGPDLRFGHLEWKQRRPYLSNEQMLRAMEVLYNKQQGCTHYKARMIYDRSKAEHAKQLQL